MEENLPSNVEKTLKKYSQTYGYMLGAMELIYSGAIDKNDLKKIINKFDKNIWEQIHDDKVDIMDFS
jgi:hypothetical protein